MAYNYKLKNDRTKFAEGASLFARAERANDNLLSLRDQARSAAGATYSSLIGAFTFDGASVPPDSEVVKRLRGMIRTEPNASTVSVVRKLLSDWADAAVELKACDGAINEFYGKLSVMRDPDEPEKPLTRAWARGYGEYEVSAKSVRYTTNHMVRYQSDMTDGDREFMGRVARSYALFHGITPEEAYDQLFGKIK